MSRVKGKKAVVKIKRIIAVLLCAFILFCFSGCHVLTSDDSENLEFHENAAYDSEMIDEDDDSFIFTWLSYMEIAVTDSLKLQQDYASYIGTIFASMSEIGVTDCFVQVRPFADALYKSEIFPVSTYAEKADFDVLGTVTAKAKEYNIAVHAWINPYRLSGDTACFSAYDIDDDDLIVTPSGTYFSPASLKVQRLILDGARELMENYDIKGIHIDDYFYPPDMNSADEKQFELYKDGGGRLSLSQWRRENVSALLMSLYNTVKTFGEDKIFSVSPSGDKDKNTNQLYADVKLWCSEKGYCDIILPQLYFGFDNESLPFEETLSVWAEMTDSEKVTLVPALALYKVGKEDIYAGTGKNEWQKSSDMIKRQIEALQKKNINSFGLYSASYINFSETFLSQELNNIKSVI
ncbi:MAG: family 10 glycosylhydrolase [Clostridia bacterium]|nr:family 10 glycosylhydrolase [Clostridia bacterium]